MDFHSVCLNYKNANNCEKNNIFFCIQQTTTTKIQDFFKKKLYFIGINYIFFVEP